MRRKALADLIAWKDTQDRKPLILQGARQVGKTYLIKEFATKYFKNNYYLNLEEHQELRQIFKQDLSTKRILQDIGLALKVDLINKEDSILILDEIQSCPEAITSLKYFYEHKTPIAICAAGSLLGIHLNSSSFPVGKVKTINIHPLTFHEFLLGSEESQLADIIEIKDDDDLFSKHISDYAHTQLWEKLKLYFITGGLPEVINVFNANKKNIVTALNLVRAQQKEIASNYWSDIAKHSGKINALHIEVIWLNLYKQLAKNIDQSVKRFKFKDALASHGKYEKLAGPIDWLCKSHLALKVPIAENGELPLTAYCKENIFKLFYFDIGILGCLANLAPETILKYDYGTYKGYFAENFVAQELVAYKHNLISWNEGSAEIEYLLEKSGKVIPLEVKSGNITQAKSLKSYMKKYNPDRAIIMSGKNLELRKDKTTAHLPLYLTEWITKLIE
jgi:predicted AAA+ superfamily ATPase